MISQYILPPSQMHRDCHDETITVIVIGRFVSQIVSVQSVLEQQ